MNSVSLTRCIDSMPPSVVTSSTSVESDLVVTVIFFLPLLDIGVRVAEPVGEHERHATAIVPTLKEVSPPLKLPMRRYWAPDWIRIRIFHH